MNQVTATDTVCKICEKRPLSPGNRTGVCRKCRPPAPVVRGVDAATINRWLTERHYLHRPMVRTKLLGYGIFAGPSLSDELVGGVLWATVHFTKKRDLFGLPDTLDKWEVLMLARFYLAPTYTTIASEVLAESIGRAKGGHGRGWRLQEDWVRVHPPVYPANPFVPRLLISWADRALPAVACCPTCGGVHHGAHQGTIYQAAGWEYWDTTTADEGRHRATDTAPGDGRPGCKDCYIVRLPPNPRAERLGRPVASLLEGVA